MAMSQKTKKQMGMMAAATYDLILTTVPAALSHVAKPTNKTIHQTLRKKSPNRQA